MFELQQTQEPQLEADLSPPTSHSILPSNQVSSAHEYNSESYCISHTRHSNPNINYHESDFDNHEFDIESVGIEQTCVVGMTGGEIFKEMIQRHKVDVIFGYPGGAVMPIFDAIYQSTDFDFILPRHEQGAGHMAEGYARATGKPGIVLVTSGPGATNTVTALNNAFKDGTPLLVFSGQVPTDAVGSDAFQEMDIVSITRPCTKWSAMVTDIKFLPQYISHAFNVATSGRPGPVLLDMPKDITAATIQEPICLPKLSSAVEEENPEDSLDRHIKKKLREETIQRCAQLINQSQKPVIYAGQGVVSSALGPTLLRQLADKACIPVTTTLLGLGAFDEFDVKSLHMLGMHGAAYANQAMQKADLIIALGARFDERVTGNVAKFAPAAKAAAAAGKGGIVHFDISPKQINRVVHATEGVEGDIQESLTDLLPFVSAVSHRPKWFNQIEEWEKKTLASLTGHAPQGIVKRKDRSASLNRKAQSNDPPPS
ncbi:acetolactate synthase [Penicillium atrosanguineum]|uniref:acetolactate synthase n=1 Tax=Penicillium atrosanguineum TaxID=1132637 RepID=A0A9W9Q2T8_9EURO|nr:acetolactate synthase [Penicillium atrosanguineum]